MFGKDCPVESHLGLSYGAYLLLKRRPLHSVFLINFIRFMSCSRGRGRVKYAYVIMDGSDAG